MQLYCDFDGTISREDATDAILSQLADPSWMQIEAEWKAGLMGSRECMQRQIPLIRATHAELDAALDAIALDEHFVAFAEFCNDNAIDMMIVSDGVDYFIRRILSRVGLQHLPIIANQLQFTESGYTLQSPYADMGCASASGVCKCKVVARGREPRIYVGDGRSDFCVSEKPEIVFAKKSLATYCAQNAIPFIAYDDFSDVQEALGRLIAQPAQHLTLIQA